MPARAAPRGPFVVRGLLGIAILLGVTFLLRSGLPWTADTPGAGEPPQAVAGSEGAADSAETIPVNVNATPWASVEVDGEYLGVTPLADVPLSPGPHLFRARMPDGEIREHRVDVSPTERHVVFYADIPDATDTGPPAAPTPPRVEEPPAASLKATPDLERVSPEPVTGPKQVASVPEPEAAPPAPEPVPEPEVEPPVPVAPIEEPPEIAVDVSQPVEEPSPASDVEAPASTREEVPEAAPPTERLAAAREPERAVPREPPPPTEQVAPVPEPEPVPPPEPLAPAPEPEPAPPPPEPISISINATPWATIEIDGEEIGVTPMAGVLLTPGDHQFRVILPDGRVLEPVIRITPENRHIAFP
jgi:hypothetical protein